MISDRKLSRRKFLGVSTAAAAGGIVAGLVVGGVAGYFGGQAGAAPTTVTKSVTGAPVTQTVTQTTGAATVTQTVTGAPVTQTTTQTVTAAPTTITRTVTGTAPVSETFSGKVGYFTPTAVTGPPLGLIKKMDLLKKYGLNFEMREYVDLVQLIQDFGRGDLDIGVGPGTYVAATLRGEGRPILACYGGWVMGNTLIVRKDSPIKSIEDLKGKTVATPSVPCPILILGAALARRKGISLSYKDFTIITATLPVIVERVAKGDIDAGEVYPPWEYRAAVEHDLKMLVWGNTIWREITGADLQIAMLVVQEAFAKKNPEAVKRFISLYIEAFRTDLDDPELTANWHREQLKITDPRIIEPVTRKVLFTKALRSWSRKRMENAELFVKTLYEFEALRKLPEGTFTNEYNPPEAYMDYVPYPMPT